MTESILDIFNEQTECEYKGRSYMVRDNGSILRIPKENCDPSKWDNVWTFGKKDKKSGYMLLASNVRIHQVVCTAFHGPAPMPNMVVDHIDTNRCNNRPENLRWCTRLENAINNPITRKKIIYHCGSVEAFLDNPSILNDKQLSPDISWMRTVTKEEAYACKKHNEDWIKKESLIQDSRSRIDDWIFDGFGNFNSYEYKSEPPYLHNYIQFDIQPSLTPGAKQLDWKTPTEFLLCPPFTENPSLLDYLVKLEKGKVFTRTKYGNGGVVLDYGYNEKENALFVLTYLDEQSESFRIKPWALAKIFVEDGFFVHQNCGSFFEEIGGIKYFNIAMGIPWTEGEVFDDYC